MTVSTIAPDLTDRAPTATHRITLPNGIELPYVEQGDPNGIPVVFLHGFPDSWHSFEPLLPYLPRSIHAFVLTQRGHGDADRPASGYAMADFAADVAAFVQARRLGPVVVVGHSMGAIIAERFAIDYPALTLGIAGIGTFIDCTGNQVLQELWSQVEPFTDPISRDFVVEFQESTVARPMPQALLELLVSEGLKVPARVWRAALSGILATDLTQEIDDLAAPALLIWGDREEMATLSEQYTLVAASPRGRLVVYEGAGHSVHWEEPARVAADIAAFVAEIMDATI